MIAPIKVRVYKLTSYAEVIIYGAQDEEQAQKAAIKFYNEGKLKVVDCEEDSIVAMTIKEAVLDPSGRVN